MDEAEINVREIHRSYQQLLEDPNWLEFADGVKARRENTCEICGLSRGCDNVRMEVHHLGYKPNSLPWEYSDDEVVVVCRRCHGNIHHWADQIWNEVLKMKNQHRIYECLKAVRALVVIPTRDLHPSNPSGLAPIREFYEKWGKANPPIERKPDAEKVES